MEGSFRNRESDSIQKFIDNLVEFDGGFGELPREVLASFASNTQEKFGRLPEPSDNQWEEVVWLASEVLIDDLED